MIIMVIVMVKTFFLYRSTLLCMHYNVATVFHDNHGNSHGEDIFFISLNSTLMSEVDTISY